MSSALGLLDETPDGSDSELRAIWGNDLLRSLLTHAGDWVADAGELSEPMAWNLLSWVEDSASRIVVESNASLVETSAFTLSLLEASPLDRRDVMLVASLVRRAADLAGLDFLALSQTGCTRAGPLGEQCLEWLAQISPQTPETHEESGSGPNFRFQRKRPQLDVDKLEQWLKGGK